MAPQLPERLHLHSRSAFQDFLDVLADPKPPEHLEIGQAVEEQDALGEPVGVLHLVDRFVRSYSASLCTPQLSSSR